MKPDTRPNVLLIVSEDHGPHLGCYGDPNARTPNLDRLAKEGVRFDNHYTTTAVCSPGRASILTGLYPHQHGQINLTTSKYAMYRAFHNVPRVFKEQGYRTARLGKLHVQPEDAFPFDSVYHDHERNGFAHRDMAWCAEQAGEFAGQDDQPWMMYACFPDAHFPMHHQSFGLPEKPMTGDEVTPPDFCPIDSQHQRDRLAGFYNCLSRLDTGVGMMIDAMKRQTQRETIVIFTTDHGQQFIRGKTTCYEGGLRVSLIMHAPGRLTHGLVRKELSSHVDLLPTLVDMLGFAPVAHRPGRSLLPLAQGKQNVPVREYVVGQWMGSPDAWYPSRSIRDGRYKLIVNYLAGERSNQNMLRYTTNTNINWETALNEEDRAALSPELRAALTLAENPPAEELYDLQEDPTELYNLADQPEYAPVQTQLRAALVAWQKKHDDRIPQADVLKAMTVEHDDIQERVYKKTDNFAQRRTMIDWQYHKVLDPGVPV